VACNFQNGKYKIKLLAEYESLTQQVLLFVESVLQNAKQLQHMHLSWHVRYPSGIQFPPQVFSSICGLTVSIAETILIFSSSRKVTVFCKQCP
jgi:hypothetical protein